MEPKTALYTEEQPAGSYKLPQHPHWGTLRVRQQYSVSGTRFGVPIPSAFHDRTFVGGEPVDQYAVTWYADNGDLYVTTFAVTPGFNQLFSQFPWTVRIDITKDDNAFPPVQWEMPGFWFNQNQKVWQPGITRYLENGFVEYDSPIAYPQASFGDVVQPIPQGTFDGVNVERFPLPGDGPDGFAWPPQFDSWWESQL